MNPSLNSMSGFLNLIVNLDLAITKTSTPDELIVEMILNLIETIPEAHHAIRGVKIDIDDYNIQVNNYVTQVTPET